jgi:hypothetical protein
VCHTLIIETEDTMTSHQRDMISSLNLNLPLGDVRTIAAAMAEQDLEYAAAYGEAPTWGWIGQAVDAATAAWHQAQAEKAAAIGA